MFSRKKKFFALSIALLCVSCLLFSGCGSSNDTAPSPSGSQTDSQTGTDRTDTKTPNTGDTNSTDTGLNADESANPTDRTGSTGTSDNDLHQRAEKIADAVTHEIPQVKDSRVVISEHMAYVSVEIDKTADSSESMQLKDEISRVAKTADPAIDTVYVMEDADTFTRMKEIGQDIADGKPVSGFLEELENMFVRVTPTPQS